MALSKVHGPPEATARAVIDAVAYEAFSADHIAILLHQRQGPVTTSAPLHPTRASDLLQLERPSPDLSIPPTTHSK